MGAQKKWVLIAAAVAFAFIGYTATTPFTITGLNPQGNTVVMTIESFHGTSCTVSFTGPDGTDIQTFAPCRFDYTAQTQATTIKIKSAHLGVLESRLDFSQSWSCFRPAGSNWVDCRTNGFKSFDYVLDDIDWEMTQVENGNTIYQELGTTPSCLSASQCYYSVCAASKSGLGTAGCSTPNGICYSCTTYQTVVRGTALVDKSRTFKVVASGGDGTVSCYGGCNDLRVGYYKPYNIRFEVINNNFYTQESNAREVPTTLSYRDADCPIKTGYRVDTDFFQAGETVKAVPDGGNFGWPPIMFCSIMPIKVVDRNTNKQISTDTTGLETIADGGSYTVPSGTTHIISYVREDIYGCESNHECNPPNLCLGIYGECVNNQCQYQGECITMPPQLSIFDRLMVVFSNWVNNVRLFLGW